MITLPKLAVTSDVDTSQSTGLVKGQGLSADFLSLLGQTLNGQLTLADGKTVSLAQLNQDLQQTDGSDSSQGNAKTRLSQLLAQLGVTSGKSATDVQSLLASKDVSPDSKTTTTAAQADATLSNQDMAALSALFAMLPQQISGQTKDAKLTDTGATSSDATDAKKGVTLASLTSSTAAGTSQLSGETKQGIAGAQTSADNKADAQQATFNPAAGALIQAANQDNTTADVLNKVQDKSTTPTDISQLTASQAASASAMSTTNLTQLHTSQVAAPATAQINAQLGTSEWQQNISQQITLFARDGNQKAELRLHPEELGAVQISLKLEDNQAQLHMVAAHSQVRAALEAALPTLRTQLAESGIQLGQSSISSESFAGQQQSGQQQNSGSGNNGNRFTASNTEDDSLAVPASLTSLSSGNNAVDIFA